MAQISLRGVHKRFENTVAVEDVSLEAAPGEFLTLVGGSGCGKTTLLRIIAGFTRQDAGSVWIDGVRVDPLPPRERRIGFVFQSYALFPTMTVAGNIAFGLRLRRRPGAEIAARVQELCALTRLEGLEGRFPHELSGGQQQRVALARALAPRPAILLLDEPLSALDAKIRLGLRAELRSIVERLGTTTLFVTHDQEEALSLSDRVAVMHAGRIVQVGSPVDVYLRPATSFVADFIGSSNRLRAPRAEDGSLRLNGQILAASVPPALAESAEALVCIRPEHVALARTDSGAGPTLWGRLAARAFLGQIVRATVQLESGGTLRADVPTDVWLDLDLRLGERIACRLAAERILLFPPDGSAPSGP